MNMQRNTRIVPVTTAVLLRQMLIASGRHMLVEKRLAVRAEMVRAQAGVIHVDVPMLGVAPLFDGVRLVTRTRPNWALYNLSQDPLYLAGKFPIPRRDLHRLQQMKRAGIQFDVLYLAHELPADFCAGQDRLELSLFVPQPPLAATRLAEGLGRGADGIVSTCLALTVKPLGVLASAGAGVAAVLRDPVLMGTVLPEGVDPEAGMPAVWFLLAAWRW